jgi:hypothetical protein
MKVVNSTDQKIVRIHVVSPSEQCLGKPIPLEQCFEETFPHQSSVQRNFSQQSIISRKPSH